MKNSKLAVFLSSVMFLQVAAGALDVTSYAAEGNAYPVYFDFEKDADGWKLDTSAGNPELMRVEENGNNFLRLYAKPGATYNLRDNISAVPNAYVELQEPFVLKANSETVISADIRTDNLANPVRSLMINRNQLKGAAADTVQYNLATLWAWNIRNVVSTYEKSNARDVDENYKQPRATEAFRDSLEANKWYNFKTTIYSDDAGKASKIKLTVTEGENIIAETEEREIENESLKSDTLTRLDMAFVNTTITIPETGAAFDIDNVRIYTITNERTWDIKCDNEGYVFTGADSIDVVFDGAMDAETINENTVMLYDEDDNKINYSGVYDKKTYTYTITPNEKFGNKKYYVSVDKANINGLASDGSVISGLSENAKDKVEFVIFNGTLPAAENITVMGKVEKGGVLLATAEYSQKEGIPGTVRFQWYSCDEENGEYTKIEGETKNTLTITDALSNMYIKVSAVAVTDGGISGKEVFGAGIKPQMKPYAKDVRLSGMAMAGAELALNYTFCDDNEDKEAESIYEWFISNNGSSWQKISGADASSYYIKDEDVGKYIKAAVTPVAEYAPYEGNTVETSATGPIKGMTDLNLVSNPGFETGKATGYGVRNSGKDTAGIAATQADAYSGEWCGIFSGQTGNSTFMVYPVSLEANTAYIFSAMMKLTPNCTKGDVSVVYYGEGNPSDLMIGTRSYFSLSKEEWTRVSVILTTNNAGTVSYMPQYWAGGTAGYEAYIDDFYIAPLLVSDVLTKVPSEMTIPVSGEVSETIAINGIRNQLGTTYGVEDEEAYFELDNNVKGAYLKDDKLYVTSNAVSGTLNLKAVCTPKFAGARQSRYVKYIPITLIANDNKTPRIDSATLFGNTSSLGKVYLNYSFYQVDGYSDNSAVTYYVSDSENGEFAKISGGDKTGLEITEEYKDKFVKAEIIPIDGTGASGTAVMTNIAGPAKAPEANNVKISGKGYVGETIAVSYDYYDFNGDKEGATRFKWLRGDSENGEYKEIAGASGKEYTITMEDKDSYICCEVTPVSQAAPFEGVPAKSNAISGPFAPTATELVIENTGKVLVGKYKYESKNGIGEGETKLEWLIDGRVVGTGASYTIDFSGTKTVEFRVTPVAEKEPAEGKSVSVTKSVSGKSGGTSGGSGGGHGGAISGTIIPPVENEDNKPIAADIENHWSKEYAERAVESNIMSVGENNNFYPDRLVTRSEFITYIFKVMGYSEIEYKNEFADVSATESYAKMLQALVDKGIISHDAIFRPNDNISRQEVAKVLSIILGLKNNGNELDGYADADKIGVWAVEYVKDAIASGIMKGVSQTEFSPRTNITNGQMAKIVVMILDKSYN